MCCDKTEACEHCGRQTLIDDLKFDPTTGMFLCEDSWRALVLETMRTRARNHEGEP